MRKSGGPLDALSCQRNSFRMSLWFACNRFLISDVVFGFYYHHQCNLSLTSMNLNILFFGYCVHRYYCNFRRKTGSPAINFEITGIGFLHDNLVFTVVSRIFGHLCKAYRWALSYQRGTWPRFITIIIIIIIIINIKDWTLWSVPSPELQLLAPTLLRSSNCSPSLWSVVVWFQRDSVLWHARFL